MTLKKILTWIAAILFILITVYMFLISGRILHDTEGGPAEKLSALDETVEKAFSNKFVFRNFCLDLRGLFSRITGSRYVSGIYMLDNGFLSYNDHECDVQPSAERVVDLKNDCLSVGTPFLYVNLPEKPLHDEDLARYVSGSFGNINQDRFLAELQKNEVDCFDMRVPYLQHFSDPYAGFYRTDHHWTPEAGLFAAGEISREIRSRYGIPVNTDCLDPALYKTTRYPDCFLGEIGKKTGAVYAGMEDLLIVEPEFPTHLHLTIPSRNLDKTGDFSICLNKERLNVTSVYDSNFYYVYMYGNDGLQHIHNEDISGGNVLIIKDSLGQVVTPYLAMGLRDLTIWDVRGQNMSLHEYLHENQFDLVILMYNGSMIKATDYMYSFN